MEKAKFYKIYKGRCPIYSEEGWQSLDPALADTTKAKNEK